MESKFNLIPAEFDDAETVDPVMLPLWAKCKGDAPLTEWELGIILGTCQELKAGALASRNAAALHLARAKRKEGQADSIFSEIAERLRLFVQVKHGDSKGRSELVNNEWLVSLRKRPDELVLADDFCDLYCDTPLVRVTTKREPDKKLVRETLAGGQTIAGAALVPQPDAISVEDGVQ